VGTRREAREQALQLLYQLDLARSDLDQTLRLFWENEPADPDVVEFATRLVRGVFDAQDRIDGFIADASTNWKVSRMSYVDRNILRLATLEFLEFDDIPPNVSMNEAIELGKRFGTNETSAFVNGILDRIARNLGMSKDRGR
jgi:N utilization substance protein B